MKFFLQFPPGFALGKAHRSDAVAGLCVAGLLLPEAVAYAGLAHVPVANALIAIMVGLACYALLGGSRFAIVAPTSSAATLAAAAVVTSPEFAVGTTAYLQAFLGLVCLSGALLALLGMTGQGQVAAFVSRPVLRGFAFALATTIVIKQLPDALGLTLPASITHDPIHLLTAVVQRASEWHGPSMLVAVAASAVMLLLKPWRAIPAAMVTIVLAISVGVMLDLPGWGVREVGEITPPQWHWSVPDLSQSQWMRMGELTFGLVLIVFAESWGSMRSLALAHGDTLNPNRELVALGACNLAVGLMQGMPVGAGFSASTANASAGAKSRWAGMVTLAVIALAVVFALPAVHLLPRPVLAVVVIHALLHALDPRPLFQAWRLNRDRIAMLGAVLAVLMLGVLHGMLVGVGLSLLMALHRFSVPSLHALGELPGTRDYIVAQGRSDLILHDNIVILRPEEPLFFANIDKVCQAIVQWPQLAHPAKVVVLSLEESSDLDSTAFEALMELDQRLALQGQTLVLSRVKESVRLLFEHHGGERWQGSQRLFWSVSDAVDAYRTEDLQGQVGVGVV